MKGYGGKESMDKKLCYGCKYLSTEKYQCETGIWEGWYCLKYRCPIQVKEKDPEWLNTDCYEEVKQGEDK